jgi:SAM-dependent methyltransferase
VSDSATTNPQAAAQPLLYLSEAVAAAAAVQAAVRLGVTDRLCGEAATTWELAAACEIEQLGAERLLEALAGLGLVAFKAGRWHALCELSGLAQMVDMWDHLDVALREGRPAVRVDTADGAAACYPDVVGNLGTMLSTAAQQAATLLPVATRVIDAGAGAAPWSLAYAAKHKGCIVTAVDLPTVLPAARRAVNGASLEGQFQFLPGDFFEVQLQSGRYDLAIAGNICHLFGEAANRRLLSILYDALTPGGTLAIVDITEARARSRSVALYELGLHLRTGSGGVHELAAYQDWLEDAGFQPLGIQQLTEEFPLMLITARKPRGHSGGEPRAGLRCLARGSRCRSDQHLRRAVARGGA